MDYRSYVDYRGEGSGPSTPWGKAQAGFKLDRGVMFYSTSSHGGLRVTKRWARENLSPAAEALADYSGGFLWFEDDCQCNIVFHEHPELWRGMTEAELSDAGISRMRELFERSVRDYYPEYFSKFFRG